VEAMRTQDGAETRPLAVPDRQCYPTVGRLQDCFFRSPSVLPSAKLLHQRGTEWDGKGHVGECLASLFRSPFKTSDL
jgi:hypothetical protein